MGALNPKTPLQTRDDDTTKTLCDQKVLELYQRFDDKSIKLNNHTFVNAQKNMAVSNLHVKLNKYHTTVKWSILKKQITNKKEL